MKDILALVLAAELDAPVIAAAGALARRCSGRARVLMFEIAPEPVYVPNGFVMGAVWDEVQSSAHRAFLNERRKVEDVLAGGETPLGLQTTTVLTGFADEAAALESRVADIVVMRRPEAGAISMRLFEGALFGSGRAVLLIPPEWTSAPVGQNIAIGWNARREAARAASAASQLLDGADQVSIITVDAKPSPFGHGQAPGLDLAAHLARRGQRAEVRNVDGLGRSAGRALLDECEAIGADLLVMGGFGRPRLQQLVFGGATSIILAEAKLPVLLAH